MIVRYKRNAAEEMLASVRYYEDQLTGLGGEFLNELNAAFQTIIEAPQRWPTIDGEVRQYRLDRFPFRVVYRINQAVIEIVAVAHLHRRPDYWRDRLLP
ncbi:MAG TPA: type II toxin-antitoxin system RelE/ParE family toxin [Tepidisphaeraceae bacterium]|nr:type II toxin-antitoxin system RelE/ParE family toxin [Tepidisphaeraceae bacterium]